MRRFVFGVVFAAVVGLVATGCSARDEVGAWSVTSISSDGRTLHLGVDVSCGAHIASSHVKEMPTRVTVEVSVHEPGGNCTAVGEVRQLDVSLRSPLGDRVLQGACTPSCPRFPRRASVSCHGAVPPFVFGYLPSGWQRATTLPGGVIAGYQSATGDATLELRKRAPDATFAVRTDVGAPTLGGDVTFGTTHEGEAAAFTACGPWLLTTCGVSQIELAAIAEQLIPR